MLTKETIEMFKKEGMSFEQITELNRRMKSVEDGTAKFYTKKEAYSRIFNVDNKNIKCMK